MWLLAFVLLLFSIGYPQEFKSLEDIAKLIREGKIKVGKDYTMSFGGRFHNIHTKVIGMDCSACHLNKYPKDFLYIRRYKVPVRGAPGVVDRSMCISCHKGGKVATQWYTTR